MQTGISIICKDGISNKAEILTKQGVPLDFVRSAFISLEYGEMALAQLELCLVSVAVCVEKTTIENLTELNAKLGAVGYKIVKTEEIN